MKISRSVLGGIALSAIALVIYHPIIAIGFFAEDYSWMDWVVRLRLPEYLGLHLGQCVSAGFCRPAQAVGLWFEYLVFGNNATAFRIIQILVHISNCLLLYALTDQITKRWPVSFLAALSYNMLPAIASAFFWFNISDQASTFYYLAAIILWLCYLREEVRRYYLLTIAAFVLALLNKEVGITVPIALFLADRWIVRRDAPFAKLFRRYVLFALIIAGYGLAFVFRYATFTSKDYTSVYAGLGIGWHIVSNLGYYLSVLATPWQVQPTGSWVSTVLAVLFLVYFIGIKRDSRIAFVCALAILPLLPVLLFTFAGPRYLYMSLMTPAVLLALLLAWASRTVDNWRALRFVIPVILALLLFGTAMVQAEAFDHTSAYAREYRLPVRSIFQRNPTFRDDTLLYFVNSPIVSGNLAGMVSLRYGANVWVGGTDLGRPAELRKHAEAYVYTFDDEKRVSEYQVAPVVNLEIKPKLPITFSAPIRLDGYEVVNSSVKRGEALILILYFRALARIDQDYTLFAHLIDSHQHIVAGSDSQPQGGQAPTSTWRPNTLIVDCIEIPITDQVSPNENYQLEVGWYFLPTLERVLIQDMHGSPVGDNLILGPFTVLP